MQWNGDYVLLEILACMALPIGALSAYAELAEFRPRLDVARPVLPLNGSYHKVSTEIADTKEGQVRQWHTQFWCQRNSLWYIKQQLTASANLFWF